MIEQPASKAYVDAPIFEHLSQYDHWSEEAAKARLASLRNDLPFALPPTLRLTSGECNDVWDLGPTFLKICWRADRDRLLREAVLLDALPHEIPHAQVRASGRTLDYSWTLTDRMAGVPMNQTRDLSAEEYRDLARQRAHILRRLHEWSAPSAVLDRLGQRPGLDLSSSQGAWAADLIPLPVAQASKVIELARGLPYVDTALMDSVARQIASLRDVDDSLVHRVVVHGDPAMANWMVKDGKVSGLLDFEWARVGDPVLDLVTTIHTSRWSAGTAWDAELDWLRVDYSELFQSSDMDRRLWLYELVFFLRSVVWWPPAGPEPTLESGHPLHTLRRLLHAPL